MSADVYFQRDIRNVLNAATVAGLETATMSGDKSYLRGFCSAIRMVALTVGINPAEVLPGELVVPVAVIEG